MNVDRPGDVDIVTIRELTGYPHDDDEARRQVVERMGFALLPQFVAEGDVLKQGRYFGTKRTQFHDGEVAVFDEWSEPYLSFRATQPIDDSKRAVLKPALDRFVANALDIRRGPARWSRYVPARVRDFASQREPGDSNRYSDAGHLRGLTAALDAAPFYLWSALEQPHTFQRFLDELYDGAPALHDLLARYRPQLVRTLRGRTPSHIQRDTAFLSQVLLGAVWKVRNGDAGVLTVASLPESQYLYGARFGISLVLLFEWAGNSLRVANVGRI